MGREHPRIRACLPMSSPGPAGDTVSVFSTEQKPSGSTFATDGQPIPTEVERAFRTSELTACSTTSALDNGPLGLSATAPINCRIRIERERYSQKQARTNPSPCTISKASAGGQDFRVQTVRWKIRSNDEATGTYLPPESSYSEAGSLDAVVQTAEIKIWMIPEAPSTCPSSPEHLSKRVFRPEKSQVFWR